MAVTVIGIALIALAALLIAAAAGLTGLDFRQGVWPFVAILPLIGFPIGILLIVGVMISLIRRRARDALSGPRG